MGLEPIPLFSVDPVGIEPTPLVLQTSVRTSYTKGPIVGHCGIEPHLLTERFYRPLITPVTEASQLIYSISHYRTLSGCGFYLAGLEPASYRLPPIVPPTATKG